MGKEAPKNFSLRMLALPSILGYTVNLLPREKLLHNNNTLVVFSLILCFMEFFTVGPSSFIGLSFTRVVLYNCNGVRCLNGQPLAVSGGL